MNKKYIILAVAIIAVAGIGVAVWFANPFAPKLPPNESLINGNEELESGDFNSATKSFKDVLLREPENTEASLKLAEAQSQLGKTSDARNTIETAALLNPSDKNIHDKMLEIYARENNAEDALLYIDGILDDELSAGYLDLLHNPNNEIFPMFGNTMGNIINDGLLAYDGEKIYYSEKIDGYSLYSANPDGSNKTKLVVGKIDSINISGDYLYFIDKNRNYNIFKVKKDGSDLSQVKDVMATDLIVYGNKALYVNWIDDCHIYKMNLDGSDNKRLQDDVISEHLIMRGAWIYYVNRDPDESFLYRVKINGENNEPINDASSLFPCFAGGNLFFINWSDEGKLYKMMDVNYAYEKIAEERSGYINSIGDTLFYINFAAGDRIYRIDSDGSNKKELNKDGCTNLLTTDDSVYYYNNSDGGRLYKINSNGGNRRLIGY